MVVSDRETTKSIDLVELALAVDNISDTTKFVAKQGLPNVLSDELSRMFEVYLREKPTGLQRYLTFTMPESEKKLKLGIETMAEMREVLNPEAHLPLAIEKAQVAITDMVAAKHPETTQERDKLLQPWEVALERMVKAREVSEMVGILINKDGVRQVLRGDKRDEVANWVYGVMENRGEVNYVEFEKSAESMILKASTGFGEMSSVGVRGVFERERILMPWLYMLLTGNEKPYMQRLVEDVGIKESVKPRVQVGVAVNDFILQEGQLLEHQPSIRVRLKKLVTGVGARDIELKRGTAISCGIAGEYNGRKVLVTEQLKKLGMMRLETSLEHLEKIGINDMATWLTLPLRPSSDVAGQTSVLNKLIATHSGVAEGDCTLALPLATEEAVALLGWQVAGVDKECVIRRAMLLAHMRRAAGLSINGGFGSTKDVASTPFWASLAYNLAQPEDSKVLTQELLIEASKHSFDEETWVEFFTEILRNRVSALWVEVMGGGETVDEDELQKSKVNNPASMLASAYYTQHMERLFGLLEHGGPRTLGIGHSMGGQLRFHQKLMQPVSTRQTMQTLAIASVSTSEEGAMPFLYKGLNKLTNLIISLGTAEESSWQPILSKSGMDAGELIGLVERLIHGMTNPKNELGMGSMIGEQLAAMHYHTLFSQIKRLGWQKMAIHNIGNEYWVQELIKAVMMIGGDGMTVLYGEDDPVLNFKKNWKTLLSPGLENLEIRSVSANSPEQLKRMNGMSGENKSLLASIPGLPHYLEATLGGQRIITAAAMRQLGITSYGRKKY